MFADGTQSIYLADMSGDGLTDLVRIRNGEVCYWPNLGYGRFGAKVTMDNAPWFDAARSVRPTASSVWPTSTAPASPTSSISGATASRLYFNQSGNGWSAAATSLRRFRASTTCRAVQVGRPARQRHGLPRLVVAAAGRRAPADALHRPHGRAEAAPAGQDAQQPRRGDARSIRAVDEVLSGRTSSPAQPWITRLPFPVHCVEKVTVTDKWRKTTFSTTYSYHHGYFDGVEREFRGFGRVEQIDVEGLRRVCAGNAASPYITDDTTLYQPPVKTVTWFHTGAVVDRQRILSQFKDEYFPRWFEALRPGETASSARCSRERAARARPRDAEPDAGRMARGAARLQGHDAAPGGLRARRRCAAAGRATSVKLFSAAYHNCHIRRLQPQEATGTPCSWSPRARRSPTTTSSTCAPARSAPDPRIAHTLNLQVRRVRQRAAVGRGGLSALGTASTAHCRTDVRI